MPGDIEKTLDEIQLRFLLHFHPIQAPVDLTDWSHTFMHSGFIVTELTFFKTTSPFQHQYIRMAIQPPPGQQPEDPIIVRIERTIRGNGVPGWIGIYGSAYDTATVLPALPHSEDHRLHSLRWEVAAAPPLRDVITLIISVQHSLPRYCVAKTSCYTFSRAIFLSVNELFHHHAQYERDPPKWYLKESCLYGVCSAGSRRALWVARSAAYHHRLFTVTYPGPA